MKEVLNTSSIEGGQKLLMWQPKTFRIKTKKFNKKAYITSATELYGDDILISNGIDFVNWGEDTIQLIVCDFDGIVGCKPGGWGTFRKAGDYILLIPLFDEELDWSLSVHSHFLLGKHCPPAFMTQAGAMVISLEQYKELKKLVPWISPVNNIKNLSSIEVARLIQWDAPNFILGIFPKPIEFQDNLSIVTDQEDEVSAIERFRSLLNEANAHDVSVELVPITDLDTVASFFVDDFREELRTLCFHNDDWHLYLEPGYRVTITFDGNS